MIEPFTSTRKILLLALGIINLVVYHGLITHDSYNILSSRNEPITHEQLDSYLVHVGCYRLSKILYLLLYVSIY